MDVLTWMVNGTVGWIILSMTFALGFVLGALVAAGSHGDDCKDCSLWHSWIEHRLESSWRE